MIEFIRTYRAYLIILVLCFFEFRLLMIIHNHNLFNDALTSLAPLFGNAWWKAFQNRLLSGIIIAEIPFDMIDSFKVFVFGTVVFKNVLFYHLVKQKLVWVVVFVASFVLMQDVMWLCGWDMLDMLMIIALLFGIDRGYKTGYFIVIFSVFIFNRESALFIPLWMLISGYKDKKQLVTALTMMGAGIGLVFLLRSFFVESVQAYIGTDPAHPYGNHLFLKANLTSFFNVYLTFDKTLSLVPSAVMLLYGFGLFHLKRMDAASKRLMLFIGLIIMMIMVTGVIHESRVWLILLPVAVYLWYKYNV